MKFNINEEDRIYKEWDILYGNQIVRDGVVSEQDYNSPAKKKIVFILKDVNSPDGGGWDLRKLLLEGEISYTWSTVARWVHGINNLDQELDWKVNYAKADQGYRQKQLKSICVMNLKKTIGKGNANEKEIHDFALQEKNQKLLVDQYTLYNPDFTICGGTGYLFRKVMEEYIEEKSVSGSTQWETTPRGIEYLEAPKGKYIISFSHPEARIHKPLVVYGLLDAIKSILKKGGN